MTGQTTNTMITPNPGSKEAIEQGCQCPVADNNNGRGFPCGKDGSAMFWYSCNCPVHRSEQNIEGVVE